MPSKQDYNNYLAKRTASLIRENFAERGVTNFLVVQTGRKWKRTLGHIKTLKTNDYGSTIEIFDLEVPEYVLDYVIMHELTHYFQGFASNHEKKHKHPHRGGIVEKELARLGWEEIQLNSDKWIKENWDILLKKNGVDATVRRRNKKKKLFGIW